MLHKKQIWRSRNKCLLTGGGDLFWAPFGPPFWVPFGPPSRKKHSNYKLLDALRPSCIAKSTVIIRYFGPGGPPNCKPHSNYKLFRSWSKHPNNEILTFCSTCTEIWTFLLSRDDFCYTYTEISTFWSSRNAILLYVYWNINMFALWRWLGLPPGPPKSTPGAPEHENVNF